MSTRHSEHLTFAGTFVSILFPLILLAPEGRTMEQDTFAPPYASRVLGLSTAWINLAASPSHFSSGESCSESLERLKTLGFDSVIVGEAGPLLAVNDTDSMEPLENVLRAASQMEFTSLLLLPIVRADWSELAENELTPLSESVLARAEEFCNQHSAKNGVAGWVLPYEIDDADFSTAAEAERLTKFLAEICVGLREMWPGGLVIGTGSLSLKGSPQEAKATWSRLLERISFDALIMRDGIGGRAESELQELEQHLGALVRAADSNKVRLWGGVETFETREEEPESVVPTTGTRLRQQIERLQKYSERLIAFPVTETLLPKTSPAEQSAATEDLLEDYGRWHRRNSRKFSPNTPVVPVEPAEPPIRTIEGSFSQIIGTARYFADPQYVGEELDRMKNVGIRLIIPDSTFKDIAYYPSQIIEGREGEGDAVGTILNEAGKREMEVLISLPHFDYSWVWTFGADTDAFLRKVNPVIEELHTLFGERPAFAGWYIPYELCDAFLGNASHRQKTATAFKGMIDTCHRLAPGKPVMISPYFTTNLPDPEFKKIWSDVIRTSGVDILAMQDSVGALNVSGTETLRMQHLRHYIHLIADICESVGTEFWWNVETFRQTHGTPIDTQGWSAVTSDFERVKLQTIYAAERANKIIQFDFPHYFSPGYPNAAIAERNKPFYEAYKKWFESL